MPSVARGGLHLHGSPARAQQPADGESEPNYWKKPEKMFSGGKGGHCPPILAR